MKNMRVLCIHNLGRNLSAELLKTGYTIHSEFPVSIGKEYSVFGMKIWEGFILVLLSDDNRLPNWFPISLFMLTDSRLPEHWSFTSIPCDRDTHEVRGLWGYDRLITDETHHDALLEREPEALRHFYNEVRIGGGDDSDRPCHK